jgi:hypothetical protein
MGQEAMVWVAMGWVGTGWVGTGLFGDMLVGDGLVRNRLVTKKLQRTLLLLTGSKGRLRVRAILGCFGAVFLRENFEIIMYNIGLFIMLAQTFSIFIFNDFFFVCPLF